MTELEQLIKEWNDFISFRQKETGLTTEYKLIQLSSKYSVTLRNSDSSADNNKVEQTTTEEELVSKIEDMALNLAEIYSDECLLPEIKISNGFWHFKDELRKLFKTHRNTVSTAANQKDDKYSSRGETESKIAFKNSIRFSIGKMVTADQELDQIVENIVEFFVDTVNPVFRALNDSDEQSIIK